MNGFSALMEEAHDLAAAFHCGQHSSKVPPVR